MITIICGAGIHISQKQVIDIKDPFDQKVYDLPLVLAPSSFFKILSMGHEALAADMLWLDAVQYIGSHARKQDKNIVYDYLDRVTDLDPYFLYAYRLGQFILPEVNEIELADALSQKGMLYNPQSWELPYFLAFIHHFYAKDYDSAADYYMLASNKPGVLPSAATLAASARGEHDEHEMALLIWNEIFENTDNSHTKELAAKRIIREQNIILLEKVAESFQNENNRTISDLDDLVQAGFMPQIPHDPEGRTYIWNANTLEIEIR